MDTRRRSVTTDRVPAVPSRKITVRAPRRRRKAAAGLLAGAVAVAALAGCEIKRGNEDLVAGKQQFVAKCGSCHVLNRAGTSGTTGPNLDAAFHQSVQDGFKRSTFQGQIYSQIRFPNRNSLMGALARNGKIPHDSRTAQNIAAYVASVVARPGSDTGALARAVEKINRVPLATAKNGTLDIDAFPNGELKFIPVAAQAPPGKVVVKSVNKASIGHNIAVDGNGVNQAGPVVTGGKTSEITVTLKPGTYQFLCTVPGHAAAGMKGVLTVK
jgi:plastocyanin